MHTEIQESKKALRRQMRERLAGLPESHRAAVSTQARALLKQQPVWKEARSVLFFAPMPGELDLWPLVADWLETGKIAALPRFDPTEKKYVAGRIADPTRDIRPGQFGIREPDVHCPSVPLNELDLVLVPGTAFDLNGRRLGRGKGFYDRLLTSVRGKTCGIAFDEQIVSEVPFEPHDVRLNYLLTPTRWIGF
jgi:5-formyltetrahydrofolate cyclo-ligase